MATLTVRNLDAEVKRRLKVAAAERGLSMEEHVRQLLQRAAAPAGDRVREPPSWYDSLRAEFSEIGFIDELEIPVRTEMPREVDFSDI